MGRVVIILLGMLFAVSVTAQTKFEGKVSVDKTVHDFGDISVGSGPVKCTFTITNISGQPLAITSVVSSCGCTDVNWTRPDIAPGKSGTVTATYSNDEGPYPFDKTLTVWVSGLQKRIILHLRGVVCEKARPMEQTYPVHFGKLALRSSSIKAGNLSQGEQRSGEVTIVNLGDEPLKLEFKDVSPGLIVSTDDEVLAPHGNTHLCFTITASRERWGKNWYYATPVINGKVYRSKGKPDAETPMLGAQAIADDGNPLLAEGSTKIGFWAITKESFPEMTKEERKAAPLPAFTESTYSYGAVKAGKKIEVDFKYTNKGTRELKIYKIDSDSSRIGVPSSVKNVQPGKEGKIHVTLNTTGVPKGEHLFVVNLYTNSPTRPIVNLYLTGIVK